MSKKNTNCLDGMRCPKCGSLEPMYISATCTVKVYDDGTDETGDFDWDKNSSCTCGLCGFDGLVAAFMGKEVVSCL